MRRDDESIKEFNCFKVVEVLEERESNGKYDPQLTPVQPTHYKLKCELVKEEINVFAIAFSESYELN